MRKILVRRECAKDKSLLKLLNLNLLVKVFAFRKNDSWIISNNLKEERRKIAKKDFKALMKETESIDRHSYWADIKKTIDKDERYLAVVSSSLREDWFYNYVESLQNSRGTKRRRSRSKERISIGKKVMYNQGWRSGDGLGKK